MFERARFFWLIMLFLLVLPVGGMAQGTQGDGTPVRVAQARNLFDLLFGPKQPSPPPAVTQPRQTRHPATQRTAPRVVVPEPDIVEKAEGATRLAIFGDSLAIDLAKAFQRAYADDPNLVIVGKGVGSSGFVRDDFFDWNQALADEIAKDSFDLAVLIIGINDKQPIGRERPLSDAWKLAYRERLDRFISQMRAANKPLIWVGLPPMRSASYSAAISEISSLHRLAATAAGVEFVDIYDRFLGENGRYSRDGPNLNGQVVRMRKSDGIHFSAAGSDKLVFFIKPALRNYYRGGAVSVAVFDPLEGTDAASMVRPPFQGNGQFHLLEVAGAVVPISSEPVRAAELVHAPSENPDGEPFDPALLYMAPEGRADDFGVGVEQLGVGSSSPDVQVR